MHLKPPANLELPESGTVDLMTTYEVKDGMLCPVAIDGKPVEMPEYEESEGEEGGEEYGNGESESESEQKNKTKIQINFGGGGGFMDAIEQALRGKQ